MSQLDSFPLNDWGSIALICACHVGQNISNIKDLNGKGFKMDERASLDRLILYVQIVRILLTMTLK